MTIYFPVLYSVFTYFTSKLYFFFLIYGKINVFDLIVAYFCLVSISSKFVDKINIFIDDKVMICLYTHRVYNLSTTSLYTYWAENDKETVHFQQKYWKSHKIVYVVTSLSAMLIKWYRQCFSSYQHTFHLSACMCRNIHTCSYPRCWYSSADRWRCYYIRRYLRIEKIVKISACYMYMY